MTELAGVGLAGGLVPLAAAGAGALGGLLAHRMARCLVDDEVPVATGLACLVGAIGWAGIAWRYGASLEALELCLLCLVLFVASLTDLAAFVIPDACTLAAVAVRVAYQLVMGLGAGGGLAPLGAALADAVAVIATLALLTLAMDRLLGRDSMGGGDIKLLGVAALYVGWRQCLMLLPLACCLGLASALLRPSGERAGAFPFGPSIALALWVTLLVGPEVELWLRAWVI